MREFRYAGIETFDINNGTGFGVTLFVQGCTHHCNECHNPETWDFHGGREFDLHAFESLRGTMLNPNIRRLTLSGGEPFDNYCAVYELCRMFKLICPEKELWIYTGYTYESLVNTPKAALLNLCDVLVDGEYESQRRDLSLPFRGSANQRVIDMVQTRIKNQVCLRNFEGERS